MICIGDSLPTADELAVLNSLSADTLELTLQLYANDPSIHALLAHTFTTRPDEAEAVFRAQESRRLCENMTIEPFHTQSLTPGSVTLDNSSYGRYKGELQISKIAQPADERINVIGQIPKDELFLLKYLKPAGKFRFKVML